MLEVLDENGDWRAFVQSLPEADRAAFDGLAPEDVYMLQVVHGAVGTLTAQLGVTPRQMAGALAMAAAQVLIYHRHGVGFAPESIASLAREARRWLTVGNVRGHG